MLATGRPVMGLGKAELPAVFLVGRDDLCSASSGWSVQDTSPVVAVARSRIQLGSQQARDEDSRVTTASSMRVVPSRQGRTPEEVALDRRGLAPFRIGDRSEWQVPVESGGIFFMGKSASSPDVRKAKPREPPTVINVTPVLQQSMVQLPVVGTRSTIRPPGNVAPSSHHSPGPHAGSGANSPGSHQSHEVSVGGGAKIASPRTLIGGEWPPADESWEYGLGPPLPLLDRFAGGTQERVRWTKDHMQASSTAPPTRLPIKGSPAK